MSDKSNQQGGKEAAGSKRPSRKRGTAFPVVSLPEAARIVKDAGKYGFEHHIASFATYMGHSTTNSGAFRQRLAAFRDWELVDGRGDTLTMTDIARKIAMPTDEAAERQALQQAFKNCEVFTGLYDRMAKGRPLDRDGLAAQAVHGFGVSPAKAHQFVRSFIDSVVAAQLAEADDQDNVVLLAQDTVGEADDALPPDGEPDAASHEISHEPTRSRAAGRSAAVGQVPAIRQSWPITGGEIIFEVRSEEALPATVFGDLGEVVTKLEALSASLNVPDDSGAIEEGGEE